jgi:tetratricopeptide (TPR) repeat protein
MQYNVALTYFQLNRFEDARKPLAAAIHRWPDLFPLNSLYGAVLMKLGELQPAYDALRHARELNPEDKATADMLYATAFDLAQQKQNAREYREALHYFSEAAGVRPQEPAPHRRMSEIYTLMQQPDEAKSEQERAEQLSKNPGAN